MSDRPTREQRIAERENLPSDAFPMLDHRVEFPAVAQTESPPLVRQLGKIGAAAFAVYLILIVFLPWQQFVRGNGQVVAFDPLDRPQVLEAPLSGRLIESRVVEGQEVRAGDVLFVMGANDPQLRENLELQRAAAQDKLEAADEKLEGYRVQLAAAEAALPETITAAQLELDAARVAAETAALQFERTERLFRNQAGGLVSERDFELARLERDRTAAALAQAEAARRRVELEGAGSLASLRASVASARSDSASAAQSLASIRSEANAYGRLVVEAPQDGVVFRVNATEGTFLSAGKPLATIVPETPAEARRVELWMDGNDVPLIRERVVDDQGTIVEEGSPVRLQFEGWPAVQFIGWPSVARGTFGGEVVLIDPTDDGTGRFRVLVAPRPDTVRDGEVVEWPGPRWLRQGVKTRGWVLLNRVPLWYEIWRQLNGFPPTLADSPTSGTVVNSDS
ncbi:MAG TPA: HlyD family efflux transporter periplasmic adaptor subunit [Longimicrobiales bacterium]|nr:HlyD family efflux transporter periplasmic adaptor subunit [Longimicrobiales bacterium]